MEEWNPKSPGAWAQLFGLIAVPMFGPPQGSALHPKGVHSLMLDGTRGSFLLSTAGPKNLVGGPDPVRWAWSANVTHAVALVDTEGKRAIVRRWDSPDELEEWSIAHEREARRLFQSLEKSNEPPSDQSVIERGLRTFRAIRSAIEKRGGSALDVVLAFNTVLAWVAQHSTTDGDRNVGFGDAIRLVHSAGLVSFTAQQISADLLDFPLGDLALLLREGDSASPQYLLEATLLIRHASGPLYQEAHKQLLIPASRESQGELPFPEMLIVGSERPHAPAPRFVHYTPPSLARALVEVGLHFLDCEDANRSFNVLDPACGSGVFLIEAVREANIEGDTARNIQLRGFDESDLAVAMADFCVRNASPKADVTVTVEQQNSLAVDDWGTPDIIAMNPPFVAWKDLDDNSRDLVKSVLGSFHKGRPDFAFAFIVRALQSLRVGSIMASLVPSSFLDGQSALAIRKFISSDNELQVRLIGHFQDFTYFGASVEPSFIVVSRSQQELPIQMVTAKSGFVDKAIRALRCGKPISKAGYELYDIASDVLTADRWTPRSQRSLRFVAALAANTPQTVADLFVPHLGIRPGNKSVFIVAERDLPRFCATKNERQFFRPIADLIEAGRIQPSGYVFYPYDTDGTLLLTSERQLREAVPRFYAERLRPAEKILKERRCHYRKWWELTRPVATWLAAHKPRIVSQAFGRAGNFAFDSEGRYAVVQGVGWCWKNGDPNEEIMLAYLGLLNSSFFDEVLSCFCPKLHGGQYQLYRQFVDPIPLPHLSSDHVRALSRIGRAITQGRSYDANEQRKLVLHAYGLSSDGSPLNDPEHRQARVGREFNRLAREWEAETAIYSFVDMKVSHPAYRKIINLGKDVIQYLLRDMRDSPGYWSDALVELTGNDPVPDDAATLDDVAAAWVKWGRSAGYDV